MFLPFRSEDVLNGGANATSILTPRSTMHLPIVQTLI